MTKPRKLPIIPLILSILVPIFVCAMTLFIINFELSCTTKVGAIHLQMIPSGVKMSTFAPESEAEISVSASEPQIARVYDSKERLTYLAIYLPRAAKRQAYLDRHDFADGAVYAPSQMLKLPDGRFLWLDFSEALIDAANRWMQNHEAPEQGILITTTYQDIKVTKILKTDTAAIFDLSLRTGSVAGAIWLTALELAALAGVMIAAAWLLFYVYRGLRRRSAEETREDAMEAQENSADFDADADDS